MNKHPGKVQTAFLFSAMNSRFRNYQEFLNYQEQVHYTHCITHTGYLYITFTVILESFM